MGDLGTWLALCESLIHISIGRLVTSRSGYMCGYTIPAYAELNL